MVLPLPPDSTMPLPVKRLITSPRTVVPPPVIVSPSAAAPAPAPLSSINGAPAYPVCVRPSITTGCVIAGSGEPGAIVCAPEPILKSIPSVPGSAFASSIAARNEHCSPPAVPSLSHSPSPGAISPPSPVVFTTKSLVTSTGNGLGVNCDGEAVPLPSSPKEFPPQHLMPPVEIRAHECRPPETFVTPPVRPDTSTGVVRSVVVPSPTCPTSFPPQHFAPPDAMRAQFAAADVPSDETPLVSPVTSTGDAIPKFGEPDVVPLPACPCALNPQHFTPFADVSTQFVSSIPSACTADSPGTSIGWDTHCRFGWNEVGQCPTPVNALDGKVPTPSWPLKLFPQHLTPPPADIRAHVLLPPASISATPLDSPATATAPSHEFVSSPCPSWP